MSNFKDVQDFHNKFGFDRPSIPSLLSLDLLRFRLGFLIEELSEYAEAHGVLDIPDLLKLLAIEARSCSYSLERASLSDAADALIDLSVVTLGTADLHGIPWQACWAEVRDANMSKIRAARDGSDSKRGSSFDVIKPDGWRPPDIAAILRRYT